MSQSKPQKNNLLIFGGTVVNDDCMFVADVLVEENKIIAVKQGLAKEFSKQSNVELIDASGRLVIPGGIDPHTHMQLPFMGTVAVDDFYHGTRAALAGGTTMIIDFAIPPKESTPLEAYKQWREWADPKGLKQCAKLRALARVHAENGHVIAEKQKELLEIGITGPEGHVQSRPEQLEAEALLLSSEALLLPLYCCSRAASAIAAQRQSNGGLPIFGEPIAAGLALDGSHYFNEDFSHAAAFVLSGQLDLVATDNCTFTCQQKRMGLGDFTKIPNGVNGVEDRMSLVWEKGVCSGKLNPMRFVAVTSTMAAKIFNIYPQKGRIQEGSDADIVIWNPNSNRKISAKTHHHATDFNVFEGMEVRGVAEVTISRGKVVWNCGELKVEAGWGKFVPLQANCPYIFGAQETREKGKQLCMTFSRSGSKPYIGVFVIKDQKISQILYT
uniref:dihydropyrimidinase n=1 Tax=Meloidogyne javanica TaxID=6303 RepID=A0A915M135_MELJA